MTEEQEFEIIDGDVDFDEFNHADIQRVKEITDEVKEILDRVDELEEAKHELLDEAEAKMETINDIASQYE